jgi:hypothetical protein
MTYATCRRRSCRTSVLTRLAEQVERIAKKRRLSDNRVLVELLEQGIEAQKERRKLFALAERSRASADPKEVKQLGDEMGRFIFGE